MGNSQFRRAAENSRQSEDTLDLSYLGLKRVPREGLFKHVPKHVTCIVMSGNSISTFPDHLLLSTIFPFNLVSLDLSGNALVHFPKTEKIQAIMHKITNVHQGKGNQSKNPLPVTTIRKLNIGFNGLKQIPDFVFELLPDLTSLNVAGNKLKQLDDRIGDLVNLMELILDSNQLTDLPHSMAECKYLTNLGCKGNMWTCVPRALESLGKAGTNQIENLDLSNGILDELTEGDVKVLLAFRKLKDLNLQGNRISKVCPELIELFGLREIDLRRNPIEILNFPKVKDMLNLKFDPPKK